MISDVLRTLLLILPVARRAIPLRSLSILLVFALTACGGSGGGSGDDPLDPLSGNQAPMLSPLEAERVDLGQALSIQLDAEDPDGDEIAYSVSTLPLPENAEFDSETGLFEFRPDDDQFGSFELEFIASDGELEDRESITIMVEPPPADAATSLSGRLLDTSSFVAGVETPIVGATVSIIGTGVVVLSDENGEFVLDDIPPGVQVFDVDATTAVVAPDGSPYANFREPYRVYANTANDFGRPVFLPRIDRTSLTTVDPSVETIVVNPNLGLSMNIARQSARTPDGVLFSGDVSVSAVPGAVAPVPLPPNLDPDLLLTIQPAGLRFDTPAPISVPNTEGFPPGSELDLWSLDPESGQFVIVGVARVSDDGTMIETIEGGIRVATWHALLPPFADLLSFLNEDNSDPDRCDGCETGSMTDLANGDLEVRHDLVAYRSQERSRALSFVYRSSHADPQPIISAQATISRRAAVPQMVSSTLEVGGVEVGPTYFTSTRGFSESRDESFIQQFQFDATAIPTGRYPYSIRASSIYPASTISGDLRGRVIVRNERESAYGAGWSLDGISKLLPQSDGSVLIVDGSGKSQAFEPAPVDLREWLVEGVPNAGTWAVAEDGSSVLQRRNGNPTFFVSPGVFNEGIVRGRFSVTGSDDDYIGFVFSYAGPSGTPTDDYDFLLFDWKSGRQFSGGYLAEEGFTLSRLSGQTDVLASFWGHDGEAVNHEVLATDRGDGRGWQPGVEYRFALEYTRDRIRIEIDDDEIFDVTGDFTPGRFGFYNYSQAGSQYEAFISSSSFTSPAGDYSRLAQNDDGTYTRTFKDGTRVEFGQDGLQTAFVDRNDNTTRFDYDASQRLVGITDPVGLRTRLEYGANGLARVIDPAQRITEFTVNAAGDLESIRDPDGSVRAFDYDARHRLMSQHSKRSFETRYEYDALGRNVSALLPDDTTRAVVPPVSPDAFATPGSPEAPLSPVRPGDLASTFSDEGGASYRFETDRFGSVVESVDPLGRSTSIERNEDGEPIRVEDPSGVAWAMSYDDRGNLLALRQAIGLPVERAASFEYDPQYSLVTRMVDGEGYETRLEYDGRGNVLAVTDPEGGIRQMTWDADGLPLSSTDELGRETRFEYDDRRNLVRVVDARGQATRFELDAAGMVVAIREAAGLTEERTSRVDRDPMNRPVTRVDPLGHTEQFEYDAEGNLARLTAATGETVEWVRDARERVTEITVSGQGTRRMAYDASGNVVSIEDPRGDRVLYEHDALNRLVAKTDARGFQETYEYDDQGNLARIIDARGNATAYEYDALRQQIARINPLGDTWRFEYDDRGYAVRRFDPNGDARTSRYDGLGRRVEVSTRDDVLQFAFDAVGNLVSAADIDSEVTFTYDVMDRPITTTTLDRGVQPEATLAFAYDAFGNRVSRRGPDGTATGFRFDRDDRLGAVDLTSGTTIDLSHDANDRVTGVRFGLAARIEHDFDDAGRFDQIRFTNGSGEIDAIAYAYRDNGQVRTISDSDGSTDFAYDADEQLISADGAGGSEFFEPDALGNLDRASSGGTRVHDEANRLIRDDRFDYAYDANGNLIARSDRVGGGTATYEWSGLDRLRRVTNADGSVVEYRYDALGRRIERLAGSSVQRWVYEGDDIVVEYDETPDPVASFVHGQGTDAPLSMRRDAQDYFYLADRLGSIRGVVNAGGEVVNRYRYAAFGGIREAEEAIPNPYGFTGREPDPATGLMYYRARYFDPEIGRFISEDPLGRRAGDPNVYRYVGNDPQNLRDPSGLIWDAIDAVFFGISLDNFVDCPGWWNGFELALDTVSLLPVVPSVGWITKADDVIDAAKGTGTVWDSIRATQPIREGTAIPKSFEVAAGGGSFWVHPNATKHMAEYLNRNGASHGADIASQGMLTSFHASVEAAVKSGVEYGKKVQVGDWELIFSQGRPGDALPVIKHALYK